MKLIVKLNENMAHFSACRTQSVLICSNPMPTESADLKDKHTSYKKLSMKASSS